MRIPTPTLVAISALAAIPCLGAEPDNFTYRPLTPQEFKSLEALEPLNRKVNAILDRAAANSTECNREELHHELLHMLGDGEVGLFEDWAATSPEVPRTEIDAKDSIYAEAGALPNWNTSLWFGTRSWGIQFGGISPSIVVDGHYFGTDKLGHFFDQGYAYYEEIYLRHTPHEMTYIEGKGIADEEGGNGMVGNGVLSYADMAANFEGFMFWRSVVEGDYPFFKCTSNGKYSRTARRFDWREYVSDAWDEGINCSEYSPLVDKVVKRAPNYQLCPIKPEACQTILDRTCGFTYLSPACLPYVKNRKIPDAACERILREDEANQVSSEYQPGFLRNHPSAVFVLDNAKTGWRMFKGWLKKNTVDSTRFRRILVPPVLRFAL